MHLPKRLLLRTLPALLVLAAWVAPLAGQEAGLSGQSMRPYRFVFYAYALAWIFVLGWVISVARRMAGLNKRLGE